MGTLHQVLVQLAEVRISLADITLILESIVNHAPQSKSSEELTDHVREDLGRLVCERFRGSDGRLRVISMEPRLDVKLRQSLHQDQLALGAGPLTRLANHRLKGRVIGRLVEQPARPTARLRTW